MEGGTISSGGGSAIERGPVQDQYFTINNQVNYVNTDPGALFGYNVGNSKMGTRDRASFTMAGQNRRKVSYFP